MPKTYADLTVANATAGNAILASDFTTLFTNSNNFRKPPSCMVRKTGTQTFTNPTTVSWDTDSGSGAHDTDDMWTSGSPTVITIRTAGLYVVSFYLIAGSATGGAITAIQVFTTITGSKVGPGCIGAGFNSGTGASASGSLVTSLAENDTVSLGAYFNGTGTGLTFSVGSALSVTWVGQVS